MGGGAGEGSGLNPITAALNIPKDLFQLGLGLTQAGRAKKLGQAERPTFQIPGAAQEALQYSRARAADPRLPGQSLIQNQMDAQTSNMLGDIAGLGAGSAERLGAATSVGRNQSNQNMNLGIQAANQQFMDQQALENSLNQYADWQLQEFKYNQDEPYRNAQAAAAREGDASNQNIPGALQGLGGTVASTIGTQGGPQSSMKSPVPHNMFSVASNALDAASNSVTPDPSPTLGPVGLNPIGLTGEQKAGFSPSAFNMFEFGKSDENLGLSGKKINQLPQFQLSSFF
jgi:hypothetical protein